MDHTQNEMNLPPELGGIMPFDVGVTILVVVIVCIVYALGYCMGRRDEILHPTQLED